MQLEESEEQHVQAERRNNSLKSFLDEKEKELATAAQRLQEALSTSAAHNTTIKQLEEAVQRYEQTAHTQDANINELILLYTEYTKQNGKLILKINPENYTP